LSFCQSQLAYWGLATRILAGMTPSNWASNDFLDRITFKRIRARGPRSAREPVAAVLVTKDTRGAIIATAHACLYLGILGNSGTQLVYGLRYNRTRGSARLGWVLMFGTGRHSSLCLCL
jgi:hypothetical protein